MSAISIERRRSAMTQAGLDAKGLNERLTVDPRTLKRWISQNRVPHRQHQLAGAALLGVDDVLLWHSTENDHRNQSATRAELSRVLVLQGSFPVDANVQVDKGGQLDKKTAFHVRIGNGTREITDGAKRQKYVASWGPASEKTDSGQREGLAASEP